MQRRNGNDLSWRAVAFQALALIGLPCYFGGTKVAEHNFILGGLLMAPLTMWTLIASIALFGNRSDEN